MLVVLSPVSMATNGNEIIYPEHAQLVSVKLL